MSSLRSSGSNLSHSDCVKRGSVPPLGFCSPAEPSHFDTGAVAHICNSKQELRNKRRLAKDEVTMRVGNGSKVDVIAVGTLPLHLPTGLVLNLNNCYLVPALSMNIVSGSRLIRDGYSFKSENNGCSIYMRDMFYGHAPLVNGLFLMNLERDVTHIHSVNTKRCKVDNDSPTYLWHCRLGHIGVGHGGDWRQGEEPKLRRVDREDQRSGETRMDMLRCSGRARAAAIYSRPTIG